MSRLGIYLVIVVALITFQANYASATTFVNFSVDGDTSATAVTQGEGLVILADCGPGNTVTFEFWIDADASGTVTDMDVDLFTFPMEDNGDTPVPDLDPADGALMIPLGPVGFAPIFYVCRIVDADSSSASDGIQVLPNPDPPAVISGHIHIQGVTAPSSMLAYIWVQNNDMPLVSAITDDMGYYELNMLSSSGTETIEPRNDIEGFATPEPIEVTYDGDTSGIDFTYNVSTACVYGDVKDIDDNPIIRDVHIYLVDQSSGERTETVTSGGSYIFTDVEPGEYKIDVTTADLIPDYLTQLYWDDPYFHFTLAAGDSIRKDLTCYPSDTTITGYITMDGGIPTEGFYIFAFNTVMGFTKSLSTGEGYFELHVAVGDTSPYRVRVGTEITPIPEGYVVEGTNYLWDEPVGSELVFNLISDFGSFSGEMVADPEMTDPDDYYMHRITIYSLPDSEFVTHMTNVYGREYTCYLSPGDYFGVLSDRPGRPSPPAMVKPVGFDSLHIASGDSSTVMDFHYNERHCDVFVHLTGVISDSICNAKVIAEGDGSWPDCYFVEADIPPGSTTVMFEVCDASWHFVAPSIPGYTPSPADTTIAIDESQTLLHLTFEYSPTGIDEVVKPLKLALGQNIPNPFNAATRIDYSIPASSEVELGIYDINGRLTRRLVDGNIEAGFHSAIWNGRDDSGRAVSSGIYLVRLKLDDREICRRMMLIK
ncbi:hypothetical protein DRQ33_07150 [bacterium]|nr:MAG: hypothetical protein DRQ33_07150 [bacterium]